MEGSRKLLLPPLFAALVLSGCGETVQSGGNTETVQPAAVVQMTFAGSNYFEIKNGVLLRYLGDYSEMGQIVLPEEVRVIAGRAFQLPKKLREKPIGLLKTQKLSIPAHVKIEEEAFYGCGPLEVVLEEGREYVEEKAFYECTKYHCKVSVKVPDSVTLICQHAFDIGHGGWLAVELGRRVEVLEKYALQGANANNIPSDRKSVV